MSDIVIKAEGIGKSYLIGHQSKERYVALRDVIVNKIRNFQSRARKDTEEFWALKEDLISNPKAREIYLGEKFTM